MKAEVYYPNELIINYHKIDVKIKPYFLGSLIPRKKNKFLR